MYVRYGNRLLWVLRVLCVKFESSRLNTYNLTFLEKIFRLQGHGFLSTGLALVISWLYMVHYSIYQSLLTNI